MITKQFLSFLFSFFFYITFSYSQEVQVAVKDSTNVEQLNEVIVSATRTIRQLSSLPLPAQIVAKKEIESTNTLRLNDILNEQTGLTTVSDFGGGEGIQIQGLDSQYTLILVDGVPLVGRSAGTLDLSRITVGNIKQIEIVKGPSSSLYGSEALGGVVNIITDTPKNGFKGNLNYRIGTFNTHDIGASLSHKKDKLAINAFINRYSSDGYDLIKTDDFNTVEPFSNYTISTKVNYQFNKGTNLLVSGRYYTQNQNSVPSSNLNGETDTDEWNAHAKLRHRYNEKWSSYFEFYATRYKAKETLESQNNPLFSDSFYNQFLIRPEIRATYKPNKKSSFIGGIGYNHETLDRTDFNVKPEFNSPYVYAQYDGNPTEKINLIVGARFDAHSEYKSQFSPKVALRYEVNDKIALKSSVGYGFKAPDFRQLYFEFSNPGQSYIVLGYNVLFEDGELKPENSIGINIGADYKASSTLTFNINIFRNNINDLIEDYLIENQDLPIQFQNNSINTFSYRNVNNVYTQGFEINGKLKVNNQLKITGGYQYLIARDKDAETKFENGEIFARIGNSADFQLKKSDYFGLANRSKHIANMKVFYTIPKWNLDTNIRGTYRSKYGLSDTNNSQGYLDKYDNLIDGYTIIDFAINKKLHTNYTLGFGIDNLLDFTDTQNINNIAGRLLYGKLNIKF